MTNIEPSAFVKYRPLKIFLNNEGPQTIDTILLLRLNPKSDLLETIADRYTVSTVAVFPWFEDPDIFDVLSFDLL